MATVIDKFDAMRITNASVQFKENGVYSTGTKFGLIGSIEGETELLEFVKRAEGVEVRKISKPNKMTLTVSGHLPVKVVRDLFGLSNKDLVTGVYAYGEHSKGKEFIFTADIVDDFDDLTKMIAFTNCVSSTGFKFAIENGTDELAELEIEFTAMKDDAGSIYYDAITAELDELEDKDYIIEEWHRAFTPDLVKATGGASA